MDDFSLDRPELNGSLISLEFGPGGRIQQLWASDPNAPEETEEFQFVAPPVSMGEELAEDYFPGTILLGARTDPDEPWILSRNMRAELISDEEDLDRVTYDYDFGFLEDIQGTGHFYEIGGIVPQIAWDLTLRNRSRRSVEIGELGFPMALNNVYEGFPRTDRGVRELFQDRVLIHSFIGGAASYLFAQRLTARPPGLLIYPGGETRWEFLHHVRASLTTPYRWEGIPIVYAHSRATIEREEWPEWFTGHSSLILEPGESRQYQLRFASADRGRVDNVHATLATNERPAIKLFPAAVVPAEVGIAVEVSGATPTRFETDVDAELETDADDEGGFCFVRPESPGAVRVSFEDVQGRLSETHLLFTEPIAHLIQARAEYILQNQVVEDEGPFYGAILPADNRTNTYVNDPEAFSTPFGVVGSLSDALFLAEKNTIYPNDAQIGALDRYLDRFLERRIVNPGDGSVGALLPGADGAAVFLGHAPVYPLAASLYGSMGRIARTYGAARSEAEYLKTAALIGEALFEFVASGAVDAVGVPMMEYLPDLLRDLWRAGLKSETQRLGANFHARSKHLVRRRYPYAGASLWSTAAFADVFDRARREKESELQERTLRCAYAARSLAPSWWWYGSDKIWAEDAENPPNPEVTDKGELCLGGSTVADSLMFFRLLERDTTSLPETYMRGAFGGLLGVWALVRSDGAGGMAFSPDPASAQFGMSWTTGDLGASLFRYLREVGAYVMPSRAGVQTFGCHFELEGEGDHEIYVVRPWDGVGRKVIVRQYGIEVLSDLGRIQEVRFDAGKRWIAVVLQNFAEKDLNSVLTVRGLWGRSFEATGGALQDYDEGASVVVSIPASASVQLEIKTK